MELVFLCMLGLVTVKASVLRTKFHNNGRTRIAASDYCERTYYQGYLAPWQEIVNTRTGSLQIWDGNSYKLSPPITILGCTNDTGSSQHTIPATLHWSKAAAQCHGMCLTNVFAIRGTDCHCLGESYIPANDVDCLPMIARSTALNSKNEDAKTVFKTVSVDIEGPSSDRCLAQNNTNGCNFEFRRCSDSLRMMCKAGTSVPASWEEAAYGCTSANSFPRPVPDVCIPGTAGNIEWYGGFRLLQYIPGSTDGTFCKRLSYSNQYATPTFKEVSCDSSFMFYCRYTESAYNEPCDVTILTSCDANFVCSDRTGTPKCLCTEDKYWDVTNEICRTRRTYGQSCDVSIPDVCADGLSCQSSGGSYTCHCEEDRYLDSQSNNCESRKSYDESCDVSISNVCQDGLSCQSTDAESKCRCSGDMVWNPASRSCQTRRTYNQGCFDGIPGFCVDGLSCQSSDGNFKCLCSSNEYFDAKSSMTCILRKTYAESCDSSIHNVCDDGLSCLSKEGSFQCVCNTTLYSDQGTRQCVPRKSYGQGCDNLIDEVCEEKMTCESRAGLYLCGCDSQHYWDGASLQCLPLISYRGDCLEDTQCSPGLTCNVTSSESNKKCICVTGSYWDRTVSCIIKHGYNQTCPPRISNSCKSNLICKSDEVKCGCPDNEYYEEISQDCLEKEMYNNTCSPGPDNPCQGDLRCLGFGDGHRCLCEPDSLFLGNMCQRDMKTGSKMPQDEDGGNSMLWIIISVAGGVVVLVLVVAAVCIKRRRSQSVKVPYEGNATFNNRTSYDSVESHPRNSSSAAINQAQNDGEYGVLGQKPSTSAADDTYAHTRQHQQEGEYDIFAKPINDTSDIYDRTHNIRQLEGGEYGQLGGGPKQVTDDDMYSHTKHSTPEGEYDSFSNTAVDKDAGVIYDSTRNVLMENAYDEFTENKGKSAVEGIYDQT